MRSIAWIASRTMPPPSVASLRPLSESSLATRELSAVCLTEAASSSVVAAVSSRLAASSSVRGEVGRAGVDLAGRPVEVAGGALDGGDGLGEPFDRVVDARRELGEAALVVALDPGHEVALGDLPQRLAEGLHRRLDDGVDAVLAGREIAHRAGLALLADAAEKSPLTAASTTAVTSRIAARSAETSCHSVIMPIRLPDASWIGSPSARW